MAANTTIINIFDGGVVYIMLHGGNFKSMNPAVVPTNAATPIVGNEMEAVEAVGEHGRGGTDDTGDDDTDDDDTDDDDTDDDDTVVASP